MRDFAGSTAGVRLVARLGPSGMGLTRKFRLAILSAAPTCRNTTVRSQFHFAPFEVAKISQPTANLVAIREYLPASPPFESSLLGDQSGAL